MKKKSINPVVVFILGLMTFGIANIIFLYIFADRIGRDEKGNVIYPMRETVLNIITLGLYGIYWAYKTYLYLTGEKSMALVCAIICACPMVRCIGMTMIAGQLDNI